MDKYYHLCKKKNTLQTFGSIVFNQLLFDAILALILFTSCQQPDQGKALSKVYGNTYIAYDGVMMQKDVRINTRRKLFSCVEKGRIVIKTDITRHTTIAGFSNITTKKITEYLIADSLYSYDTSDCTYVAVALHDLDYPEFDEPLFSSFWYPKGLSTQYDTMTILGFVCRKSIVNEYSFWMHDGIRLAIECNKGNIVYREKATKFISDTVINPVFFEQPKGFHRMIAAVRE